MSFSDPSKRWWQQLPVRLSLRTMMVLVLVLGGGFGWVIHRARVQRDAVAEIKRAEGDVAYSWQISQRQPNSPPLQPSGPFWVRRYLGPDFIDTVGLVQLKGKLCTDETLRAACRLDWLEELAFVDTGVTDTGAEELRRLTNLRSLDIRLNRITARPLRHIGEMSELRELKLAMKLSPVPLKDEDMAFLKRLTKLEELMLPSRDLTDAWLVYIEDLTNLKSLELYDMAVTSNGLDHLKRLSNLTVLTLHGTRIKSLEPIRPLKKLVTLCVAYTSIDDDALASMPDLPQLDYLDLRNTNVTDAGMMALCKLPRLRELKLSGTKITDAGLLNLASSKSLLTVDVHGTEVTDAGITKFDEINPQVKVIK